MARLAIIWRNPQRVQRHLRWTHVRRGTNRSLYLVLESVSPGKSWQGLPTLEVIRGGCLDPAQASPKRLQPGA